MAALFASFISRLLLCVVCEENVMYIDLFAFLQAILITQRQNSITSMSLSNVSDVPSSFCSLPGNIMILVKLSIGQRYVCLSDQA